jgi:hypothetical protein
MIFSLINKYYYLNIKNIKNMQIATLVIALLAGVSEARRGHHYRLMAADPPSGAICYRGNQKKYPVSGNDTPPCWFAEPDNSFSCYEYEPSTGKCPKFPNPVNKPGKPVDNKTCYRGNQKQYPVSGKDTPPCWYRESDGSNSCYEYEPTTGKCPNFPNPISKPTYHLRTTSKSSKVSHRSHLKASENRKTHGQRHRSHLKASGRRNRHSSHGRSRKYRSMGERVATKDYCYFTNSFGLDEPAIKTVGVDEDVPECWYEMEDGEYGCNEDVNYDGTCYEEGAVRPPRENSRVRKYHSKGEKTAKKAYCHFTNSFGLNEPAIKTVGADDDVPECWYEMEDGEYGCNEDVDYDGTCYEEGAVRPPKDSKHLRLRAGEEFIANSYTCTFMNSMGMLEGTLTVGVDSDIPECWYLTDDDEYICEEDVNYDGNCNSDIYFRPPNFYDDY